MLDFLSSPVLFPSDMDTPKLSATAIFKLPDTMNWADYDYYSTMMDKSMTNLTDLTKLEPVNENDMHVYAPFLFDDAKFNKAAYFEKTTTSGLDDDDCKGMALLGLAQSMVQAYTCPFYSNPIYTGGNVNHSDDMVEQQKLLRASLRGALDVVEHDMVQNGYDCLHSTDKKQQQYGICIGGEWSWREEIVDVPDLVHSVCSSPSTNSLADDHHPSTPVLLESGISSYVESNAPDQQQIHENSNEKSSTSIPISSPSTSSLQQFHCTADKKKSSRFVKKWMNKMKQVTSTVKQDCVKSISSTSRKLCPWVKK